MLDVFGWLTEQVVILIVLLVSNNNVYIIIQIESLYLRFSTSISGTKLQS